MRGGKLHVHLEAIIFRTSCAKHYDDRFTVLYQDDMLIKQLMTVSLHLSVLTDIFQVDLG